MRQSLSAQQVRSAVIYPEKEGRPTLESWRDRGSLHRSGATIVTRRHSFGLILYGEEVLVHEINVARDLPLAVSPSFPSPFPACLFRCSLQASPRSDST